MPQIVDNWLIGIAMGFLPCSVNDAGLA